MSRTQKPSHHRCALFRINYKSACAPYREAKQEESPKKCVFWLERMPRGCSMLVGAVVEVCACNVMYVL